MKKPISAILKSKKTVFTFKDISLLWGMVDRKSAVAGINYYVSTGDLHRIRRGIYAKDKDYDKVELASRIYTPAYVSFETVLARAGMIFQYYSQIFVASYLTREIIIDGQKYVYRKIKNTVLTDPAGVLNQDGIAIATKERAFLDTLYINKDYHFDHLGVLDWEMVFQILPLYGNKRMTQKVRASYDDFKSGKQNL
jgi:predicted transcriptional regulator of viral defense system